LEALLNQGFLASRLLVHPAMSVHFIVIPHDAHGPEEVLI
jgi:hypothetical protein